MRRIARPVAVIAGLLVPCIANAWEVDGLRSGMTLAEATAAVLSSGDIVDSRVGIAGADGRTVKNKYSLGVRGAHRNAWLSFCSDVLYRYDRFLPGGFEAFVRSTEQEARRLDRAATLRSISLKMEIIASWDIGNDQLSFSAEKFEGRFNFARSYEDFSRCPEG